MPIMKTPSGRRTARKIAFVLIKDGKKIVHLINPDGSGAEPITPPTQSAIHPVLHAGRQGASSIAPTTICGRRPRMNREIYSIDLATQAGHDADLAAASTPSR